MGNTQAPGIRRDRRQELILLFYFIFGFVLIRVWILLIQSNSVMVESIGAIVTFTLLFTLLLRCRVIRRQEEAARIEAGQIDVNNPDIAVHRSCSHHGDQTSPTAHQRSLIGLNHETLPKKSSLEASR